MINRRSVEQKIDSSMNSRFGAEITTELPLLSLSHSFYLPLSHTRPLCPALAHFYSLELSASCAAAQDEIVKRLEAQFVQIIWWPGLWATIINAAQVLSALQCAVRSLQIQRYTHTHTTQTHTCGN